jgi:predicted DNA-binding transcriptional regulator AlpA
MANSAAIDRTHLAAVPSLDQLASDPSYAAGLPREAIAALMAKCSAIQGVLAAAILLFDADDQEDRLLTVEEAARVLAVSIDWAYRHGKRLGLTVKLGDGTLRFSSAAIQKAIVKNKLSPLPTRRGKSRQPPESDHSTN